MTSFTELLAICPECQEVSAFLHVQMSVRYILFSLQSTPSIWDPCIEDSPVEFEILLEKITIKQINSLSYTEFSEEYENYPQQVVSFGEKK